MKSTLNAMSLRWGGSPIGRVSTPIGESALVEALTLWPKLAEYAGLSEYEAKIYLCLLGLGCSGARRISALTGVPRTKIYTALRRLIEMGLIREMPGNPSLFAPTPPNEAFGALLGAARRRVEDFSTLLTMLMGIYQASRELHHPLRGEFWYIDGEDEIMLRCRELLRHSRYNLLILAGGLSLSILFNDAHRELDELYERGVEVKILSPLHPEMNHLARELSYLFEVRRMPLDVSILLLISDGERLLLAGVEASGHRGRLVEAIYSEDQLLIRLFSRLLEGAEVETQLLESWEG
ncbi:TrmB family transcriptional regulator [Candidatus Bathyarchaeota archaeon]|nr:TrmB family transcriptional regulator [Candidatus Bathyarchaeota archaeon]